MRSYILLAFLCATSANWRICFDQAAAIRDTRRTVEPLLRMVPDGVAESYKKADKDYVKTLKESYVSAKSGGTYKPHALKSKLRRYSKASHRVLKAAGVGQAHVGETEYYPLQSLINCRKKMAAAYKDRAP